MKERVQTIVDSGVSFAVAAVSIANINAALTTLLLVGNISYLVWKWNRKRKQQKDQ